jgi:hypothetical protein
VAAERHALEAHWTREEVASLRLAFAVDSHGGATVTAHAFVVRRVP